MLKTWLRIDDGLTLLVEADIAKGFVHMKKIIGIVAVLMAAIALIAATDPLAELTEQVAELQAQITAMETHASDLESRMAYLERFDPRDTFEPIEGAGSRPIQAAPVNARLPFADGIEIAVISAAVIRKHSEVKELPEWARPGAGESVVAVDVNLYNGTRKHGSVNTSMCPWESQDTLATYYGGDCAKFSFWSILVEDEAFPLVGPTSLPMEEGASLNRITLYFRVSSVRPLEGVLAYEHPANEVSHRYWRIDRVREWN
ncbi:MAG: hypothetical protein F4X57_13020 [Chloroflexi bacterium]|nr:hypothetical protein [Chloroflexota bacterium]